MTELDGPGYADIEDHGAIGNLKSVALVSRYGSIDWCCFPQLDSPSVFAALLDVRRGGRWRVAPQGAWRRGAQHYHAGTNVLDTAWDNGGSRLVVTDFMPLRGSIVDGGEPQTEPAIHRVLACTGGSCDVVLEWWPRFDYARAATAIECGAGLATAGAGTERLTLEGLPPTARLEPAPDGGPLVRAAFTMSDGAVLPLCLWYGETRPQHGVHDWREALRLTCETWREWLDRRDQGDRCDFAGTWQPLVDRSGLALKLLTFPRTGAIAAAPTTSLPEHIGGVRNWDYRYTWIRDASFTAQALVGLGRAREAIAFLQWAEDVSMQEDGTAGELGLMYTLDGARTIREQELDHLEGYRGSRPVRIGNKAAEQFQLEALDRALRLARRLGLAADTARWTRTRAAVRASILEHGFDTGRGAFVQAYGSRALDAANLHIPLVGFLPVEDPRVQSTIDLYLTVLTENGLVYRYRTDESDDGLPGDEGAFGLTTFWMVDALALSGRVDEAARIFEGMAGRVNHVGLYPEEFDTRSGAFLGNFPQAFTHIGLINSALYLAHAEGRPVPAPAPLGSPEERAGQAEREAR